MSKGTITMYDPPAGWQCGFPRKYSPLPGESLEDTLIRDGYPAGEAVWAALYCRFWEVKLTPEQAAYTERENKLRTYDGRLK